MKSRVFIAGFITLPLAGFILGSLLGGFPIWQEEESVPVVGNVKTFEAAYARWKQSAEQNDQKTKLVMSLGYFKGLSTEFSSAQGIAALDLKDGAFTVQVSGLAENKRFDVWLVHNRPGSGRSVKPEPGDRMIRIGTLAQEGADATLHASLDRELLANFKIDLIVVAPSGGNPWRNGLLFAAPNVLQKLYYSEQSTPNLIPTKLADPEDGKSLLSLALLTPFRSLIPTLAYAEKKDRRHFADLVAFGEKLFFEEKFKGNGRTCGTCHPAENNFTIDPAFIATLRKNDPLFVAEFNKDLNSDKNGGNHFEIPTLMRQFGLILENVDGFDDLKNKFVMRGTPPTFAQALSIDPAPAIFGPFPFDGTSPTVLNRTGWGGDGAPGTGTLKEFAIGAVTQHFTRTLSRIPGVDFRLPTDAELDAIEAFMLSLGRASELQLSTLVLADGDADSGRAIFNSATGGKCAFCHFNAGANQAIFPIPLVAGNGNANFNTGVENAPHPAGPHSALRPVDGGFGSNGTLAAGFGNGTFNTPSIIESADRRALFHNNLCSNIECAVDFYNSFEFNQAMVNSGIPLQINLGQFETFAVASFLRVVNALENIRSAIEILEKAQELSNIQARRLPQLQKLLRLAIADVSDAYRVLDEGSNSFKPEGLHPTARTFLDYAKNNCTMAQSPRTKAERTYRISEALGALKAAQENIVAAVP